MRTIPLTQGQVALVDDADYEAVSQFNWWALKKGNNVYAVRTIHKPVTQYLHHFLLPGTVRVDHRDGDGLNNQRHNIRPATKSQNAMAFQRKAAGKSSRFRGVSWQPRRNKWKAHIKVGGKTIFLGDFIEEVDAARAYDAGARRYFNEFASPNFSL